MASGSVRLRIAIQCAFGPALLGWARDRWGSYSVALGLCVVCEAAAALIVLSKGERESANGGAPGPD